MIISQEKRCVHGDILQVTSGIKEKTSTANKINSSILPVTESSAFCICHNIAD